MDYFFNKLDHSFIINNFQEKKPFTSFLPALAGKRGIPLWCFYCNRGQGVSSFGLRDKNGAISEFFPANAAYINTGVLCFRTFVRINGKVSELFDVSSTAKKQMMIKNTEMTIKEIDPNIGIETTISYFGMPEENYAALVRIGEFKNISDSEIEIEILDGINQIFPAGVDYGSYKAMSNLLRSFMDVDNLEDNFAFMKLRSSTGDSSEVKEVKDGNFYISMVDDTLVKPIVDQDLIYGYDTQFSKPRNFMEKPLKDIVSLPQVTANKVPCGFTPITKRLKPNESINFFTLIGYSQSVEQTKELIKDKLNLSYIKAKQIEAREVVSSILDEVTTKTSNPLFDEYIKQSYLDNLLRGGYPYIIKTDQKKFVYHLYSRKHGDPERDYNFFHIAPEYYSQGNGNFRDVCQNRRNDIFFNKDVEDYNIFVFGNLIQLDGYNPLGIEGSTFEVNNPENVQKCVKLFRTHQDLMKDLLSKKFTPGSLINTIVNNNVVVDSDKTGEELDEFLFREIFKYAEQSIEARWNEGYWIDHWTYILDLVENYLSIYPDKQEELLFGRNDYKFFESPVIIRKRNERFGLDQKGVPHQYGSIAEHVEEKIKRNHLFESPWLKNKELKICETNLYAKLLVLAMTKFVNLDPHGIGISMEANRPGWNDAMNGLPGLFASGVSETCELKRLLTALKEYAGDFTISVPVEFKELLTRIKGLDVINNDSEYYDYQETIKEDYRDKILFNIEAMVELNVSEIVPLLDHALTKINEGIEKAIEIGDGIIPTYLIFEPTKYEKLGYKTPYGLDAIKVSEFKVKRLPYFLEAPARYYKTSSNKSNIKEMYKAIKASDMYDKKFNFYLTSTPLDDFGMEIGRARAFTKGWQERESNFLHMTYKYLLGLLKSGLYDEFFQEIKTNLVCNMNPEVYGRSTLENSSFIAPSNNPNPLIQGQGFVSRLSGSTAEVLSMWALMMYGKKPFICQNGELTLNLIPILAKEMFVDNKVEFTFLGKTKVVYLNVNEVDLFNIKPTQYILVKNNERLVFTKVSGDEAEKLRDGYYDELVVRFE